VLIFLFFDSQARKKAVSALFFLFMHGVGLTSWTVFFHLNTVWSILFILRCDVVPLFAIVALHYDTYAHRSSRYGYYYKDSHLFIQDTRRFMYNKLEKIMYTRTQTRPVFVKGLQLGGNDKVYIQSMTTTKTSDVAATVAQIHALERAGCEIVRVACLTMEDAKAIGRIKKQITIPIVADIHYNPTYALEAIRQGVDKIRINPPTLVTKRASNKSFLPQKMRASRFALGSIVVPLSLTTTLLSKCSSMRKRTSTFLPLLIFMTLF
jgi:hypothetical protein